MRRRSFEVVMVMLNSGKGRKGGCLRASTSFVGGDSDVGMLSQGKA